MSKKKVEVTLRIPGTWAGPHEFAEAIPTGCRLTAKSLILRDGTKVEINIRDKDDQFVSVFATACRREPTDDEKKAIERYTVQVCLTGPGGTNKNAAAMMRAAVAILDAGGSGVFIDNSALAFGATQWREMAEIGDSDALSFAFVNIIRGKTEAYTMGLHVLGLPDLIMRTEDLGEDGSVIIEMIQYLCSRERKVGDGHVIADIHGPRFLVTAVKENKVPARSPMYNPWGHLRLTSTKEISELN